MKTAVIGTFYKTEKSAKKKLKSLHEMWGRQTHRVVEIPNGFLVISKRQLQ